MLIVAGTGAVGIVVAMICQALYDRGIIIDELISGSISITDLQFFVVLVFILVGVIIGAIKR